MNVEDEPNAYLKFLNDPETPDIYLLEKNEVEELFSAEPILTEIVNNQWRDEEFPLLLDSDVISNNLITDECISDNIIDPLSLQKNVDICMVDQKVQDEIQTDHNIIINSKNSVPISEAETQLKRNAIFFKSELSYGNDILENCIEFKDNSCSKGEKNMENEVLLNGDNQLEYVIMERKNASNFTTSQKIIVDNSLKSIERSLPVATNNLPITNKQIKIAKSQSKPTASICLFTSVIANKCKICSFLCEDLEGIKKHVNALHPEHMFRNNGVTNGVSILLTNVNKKKQEKKIEEKNRENGEEFTVYVCSVCQECFNNKCDLKNHMIQVHSLKVEPQNNKQDENKKASISPVKKVTAYLNDVNIDLVKKQERMLQRSKCSVKGCAASFPTEVLRVKHEELHIGETKSMFKCSHCDKTFMMWPVARTHMFKEHNIDLGMIICPMCNTYKSYKAVKVLKHMMIHSEERPFLCSDCGKAFKQMSQLKNHEILHKLPEDMPYWSKVKKCDKCDGYFANAKSLKTHVKTVHERIKPFICNICGHKSSRKAMLDLHMRQHTAAKPHKCDYCNFRTGDPNSLRKHVMKHLGVAAYQCPYCPYSCIQAGSIKNHFKKKHKDKAGIFYCKFCTYTTINEYVLKIHEKKHAYNDNVDVNTDCSTNSVNGVTQNVVENEMDIQTNEETQNSFLNTEFQIEESVDKGGITIPAD